MCRAPFDKTARAGRGIPFGSGMSELAGVTPGYRGFGRVTRFRNDSLMGIKERLRPDGSYERRLCRGVGWPGTAERTTVESPTRTGQAASASSAVQLAVKSVPDQ